ncbi:MAG: hypothetical protein JRF55_12660 [Deltaproteobacteria bacterium]|nr:hypothetical protein [Deltaproteobacteria bacterium]
MRFSAVRVSGSDARNLVAKGATLLDVRSSQEFSSGHIDGAVSISVQELAGRLDELGDKNGAIVVYCQSGSRSAMAKRLLASNGLTMRSYRKKRATTRAVRSAAERRRSSRPTTPHYRATSGASGWSCSRFFSSQASLTWCSNDRPHLLRVGRLVHLGLRGRGSVG